MNASYIQGAKYVWHYPPADDGQVAAIAARYNVSQPIAQTLISRGFATPEMIDEFLFSCRERDVAHPSAMKDAERAVERMRRAIQNKEKILVFGDYDVDGITSSALMMIGLLPLGAQANFFLPHRMRDGYGLSTKIVERAAQNGYTLIITVDNGITAFEPAKRAKERGIDLIITDHHKPHDHVPEAYAIVNPHQQECSYPFKFFAGVGVTFKILSLLYEQEGKTLPPKAYELLLLGTVADVVPLLGENRFWVRYGLSYVNKVQSLSFGVLKTNGKLEKPRITSTDIGFSVTPQINALGRLEDPRQGVKFLIGSDEGEVKEVGTVLLELNEARKEIERGIVQQIEQMVANGSIDPVRENVIIAAHKGWPPGVIGLVASRVVGLYGKPTILLHLTDDGKAKGSCRSIAAFNMFEALAASKDLLEQFGGHAQAAGLSLKAEHIPLLKERLEQRVAQTLTPFDLQPKLKIDAALMLGDLTTKIVSDMQHLEPFGHCNDAPLFVVDNVMLLDKPKLLKDLHVKCKVFADGVIKPVIFFNRPELYPLLNNHGQHPFRLAARISENYWLDRMQIELQGIDIALPGGNSA